MICPHCNRSSKDWIRTGSGDAELCWCPQCKKPSKPQDCKDVVSDLMDLADMLGMYPSK